jgi:hypothetical protein
METLPGMDDVLRKLGMVVAVLLVPAAGAAQETRTEYEYEHEMETEEGEVELEIERETETRVVDRRATTTMEMRGDVDADADAASDDRGFIERWGMVVGISGGPAGYTDSGMRDAAELGAGWDARVVLGTHRTFAFEAAYIGSAFALDVPGLDNGATLLGNGAEGAFRWNILTEEWRPFVAAGVAWRHYAIVNTHSNTSSFEDHENVLETPLAIGLDYQTSRFVVGVRGTARPTFASDLVPGSDVELHNVSADIRLGMEL